MKKILLIILLTCTFLFAKAQTGVINASISSTVNSTVSGTPTVAPFVSSENIENGLISDPVTFAIKSNRLWKMTTEITSISATAISGGPTTVSALLLPSNISWGVANNQDAISSWSVFSANTAAEVKSGIRGNAATAGNTFNLRYKIIPGFDVDPGVYTINVAYTVSAQ